MATVLKGVKLRLYPNKEQEIALRQMCGNDRFLWNTLNDMLKSRYENNKHLYNGDKSKEAKKKRRYVMLSAYDMDILLPLMKQEYPFLEYSDSSALQVVTSNLSKAYSNFFKDSKQFGLPKFKKRGVCKLSYTGKSSGIAILAKRYLRLPKLGEIKSSKTGCLKDVKIKRYTIEQDSTNRWYISFQVEAIVNEFEKTNKTVGLDLGLTDMVIGSDGFKSGRFLVPELENEIKSKQKVYSKRRHYAKIKIAMDKNQKVINPRTLLDFMNVEKARVTKVKSQKRLANKRKDFLHKLSTNLVKTYDIIVIEDLKSKNMMKNHKLAKAIGNASWYEFRIMLEYKCQWYGKQLIIVSPNYTTQECSNCHHNSGKKTLDIREWTCVKCGVHHDRDINAAKNILTKGLKTIQTM
jgi:transposase, IS605 orfB family